MSRFPSNGHVRAFPPDIRVAVDPDTKQLDETTLFGGSPARVLRLSAAGAAAWRELADGKPASRAAQLLARRLTDAGVLHPRPARPVALDVTVIVPVRDRAALLDRCLAGLDPRASVVVVDDGSSEPARIADMARQHGARLVRRDVNAGPGPARNLGLDQVSTEFVAFIDSDCIPPADWIEGLAGHFADPLVGAVAPRVVAEAAASAAGQYGVQFSSLDLGDREARVVPGSRVAYVPTAALIVRRRALAEVARDGRVFDPVLRVGEDVDLVWRLHEAGWRVRYDPAVRVAHRDPDTWKALLTRRFRYGTSAAPLAIRHPDAMAPLVLYLWPTTTVAALLARRPVLALGSFVGSVMTMNRTRRRSDVPTNRLILANANAVRQTWLGIGRYLCQFAAPALVATFAIPGGRRAGRTVAVAYLLLGPACTRASGPGVGPILRGLARFADHVAYGAGVWAGCLRNGTTRPLRPVLACQPLKIITAHGERLS